MIKISQIKLKPEEKNPKEKLFKKAAQILKVRESDIRRLQILRRSIDARKKPEIYYSYVVGIEIDREERLVKKAANANVVLEKPEKFQFPDPDSGGYPDCEKERPVVIGAGPAGLFCTYYLALAGLTPILLERGKAAEERKADVEKFWEEGILDPESNVQFGEGGAGTFSDGKLNTLVKDKEGRNRAVLETFVRFGAPEAILYDAKPHIGTDVLQKIVAKMRREIIRLGGEVRFQCKVTALKTQSDETGEEKRICGVVVNETEDLPCSQVVLAIGHSARDTFEMLYHAGIAMESKDFAVGFRVEHPQEKINESQYGKKEAGSLGAAAYKVAARSIYSERGTYSFCMCPGGYVVNASSEENRLAVNGMSYSGRNGENANSAIIVAVTQKDFGSDHPLAGVAFQRKLEEKAWKAAGGLIPVQPYGIFKECIKEGKRQEELKPEQIHQAMEGAFTVRPMMKGKWKMADLTDILPEECNRSFVEGMTQFGAMIPGFDNPGVLLSGVESRTSSPLRICRDESLQSLHLKGLYPCGEGAGYAGGITSAAMDGLKVARMIAKRY